MKWPPTRSWTSNKKREGYHHFELKQFGGKGDNRWVELFPVLNTKVNLRIGWSELKNKAEWTSGWKQLPKDEDSN